jgi:WD40 repeat protein
MASNIASAIHRLRTFGTALLFSVVLGATAFAGDPPAEPILRTETGMHTAKISQIDVDASGRWLVSASIDKTVRVWDLSDAGVALKDAASRGHSQGSLSTPTRIIRPPIGGADEGILFGVAISPDGNLVATGGMTGAFGGQSTAIYLFTRSNGRLAGLATGLPHVIMHLRFSPNGRYLAAAFAGGGVRVFSVDDAFRSQTDSAIPLRVLAQDKEYANRAHSVHFTNDSTRLVTTSDDGYLRLYDLANLAAIDSSAPSDKAVAASLQLRLIEKRKAPGGQHPQDARFSPDGNKIAVVFNDTPPAVNVLSAQDLSLLYAQSTAFSADQITWSPDGRSLYASELANGISFSMIHKWPEAGRGKPQDFRVSTKSLTALATLPDGTIVFGGSEPVIGILTPEGNQRLLIQPGSVDYERNLFRGIYLSPGGTTVRFAYDSLGGAPALFSITGRRLTLNPRTGGSSGGSAPKNSDAEEPLTLQNTTAPGLDIKGWMYGNSPTLNGKPLQLQPSEISKDLAIAPDNRSFVLATNARLLLYNYDGSIQWQVANLPEKPVNVNIASRGELMVAAFRDGTIRWYSMIDGKELLAFFPHTDRKRWVLWTPEGYFDASAEKSDLIGYHLNQGKNKEARFISMQELYDVFYRPDIIQAKLKGEDVSGLITVTAEEALKTPPPEVKFTSIPTNSSEKKATICYQIKNTGGGIGEVRLFQNGKLIRSDGFYREIARNADTGKIQLASLSSKTIYQDQRSLIVKEKKNTTASVTKSRGDLVNECVEIETMVGENDISLAAFNAPNTVQSFMETASFISTITADEPHLYILSVGIDLYRDKSISLKYAAKDAKDFIAKLPEKARSIYKPENIHVIGLSDNNAGKQNILKTINELAVKIRQSDGFVFFNASHGVLLQNQYFIVTADFDGNLDTRNALISSNEIVEISKKIKSLSQLYIFDTCHAGGVDSIVSALYDARMANLARKMGLHVYASAGSIQTAMDGYQGNGLYTSTLLHGIGNGKLVDKENSGMVTYKSLGLYTKEKTTEISSRLGTPQTPVIINFGRDNTLFTLR